MNQPVILVCYPPEAEKLSRSCHYKVALTTPIYKTRKDGSQYVRHIQVIMERC